MNTDPPKNAMGKLPVVAIAGRRNVGKSTFFNAVLKRKKAIVDSIPGLTRDVISCDVEYRSIHFTLADTPGLDLPEGSELSEEIRAAAHAFLAKASVIILLMEKPAPEAFDLELADFIRKIGTPAIIAVNKMDGPEHLSDMTNFYETGLTDVAPVSAKTGYNLTLVLDKVIELLPVKKTSRAASTMKIAIVGRPNSGKSTLLNAFLGYERVLVSDIPGTTRDAVDEDFTFHGKRITVIDTAGIRRRSRVKERIDIYSLSRAVEAISECDVVIHLIDAVEGVTETDKKIADEIVRSLKPAVIAVNKWDAIEKDHRTFDAYIDRLRFRFFKVQDFPIITISAKHKIRIHRLIEEALQLHEKAARRIDTARLNRLLAEIQAAHRIPQLQSSIRIYYATQTDTVPPRFVFFVNRPDLFRKDIVRYFEKALQKELDLKGIPIVITIEGRKRRSK